MSTASQHTTINDWRTAQQAQRLSNRTIIERTRVVERLGNHIGGDPAAATAAEVTDFLAGLEIARATAASYHSYLRAWFRWLVLTDRRLDDPMVRVPVARAPKRQPRPVTDRELSAILTQRKHRRTQAMIMLACLQGLRVHEIAKTRGEDVNVHDMQLTVLGKGDQLAVLPLHPLVADLAAQMPPFGWWFPSHTQPGRHIRGKSVTYMISQVFRRAGVKPGAHRLRHWYATRLLRDGANLRVVQQLMRHASLETTSLYTKVEFEEQRNAIDGLRLVA